jgi:hypothetical protein
VKIVSQPEGGAAAAASDLLARLLVGTTARRDKGCYPETPAESGDGCFPRSDAPREGCFPERRRPRGDGNALWTHFS